jgi:DNA-binding transcriptional regulator YiaG
MQSISRAQMPYTVRIWRGWIRKEALMAKKFSELAAKMPPEARAAAARRTNEMLAEMALAELRRALGFSQEELAGLLEVKQPSVAKLEQRTDMYISTLRDHIHALGGELIMIARFPDRDVKLSSLGVRSAARDAAG